MSHLSEPKRQILAPFYRGKWQQRKSGWAHWTGLEPECQTPSPGPFALQNSLSKWAVLLFVTFASHSQRYILSFHSPGPPVTGRPGGALTARWPRSSAAVCRSSTRCAASHESGRARFRDGLLARTPELEPLFRDVLSRTLESSFVTPGQLLCDQRLFWWQAIRPKECSLSRTWKDLSSHKTFFLLCLQLVDHTAFGYCRRWGYSHTKLWLYWNHGSRWA